MGGATIPSSTPHLPPSSQPWTLTSECCQPLPIQHCTHWLLRASRACLNTLWRLGHEGGQCGWTRGSVEWASKEGYLQPLRPNRAWKEGGLLWKPAHQHETLSGAASSHACSMQHVRNGPILHAVQPSFQLTGAFAGSPSKQNLRATLRSLLRTRLPWGIEQISYNANERKFRSDAGKETWFLA